MNDHLLKMFNKVGYRRTDRAHPNHSALWFHMLRTYVVIMSTNIKIK